MTRHHPTVVASTLREVGPHPGTGLHWSGLVCALLCSPLDISTLIKSNPLVWSVTVTWLSWSVLVSETACRDCYEADPLCPFIVITALYMNQLNSVLLFTKHATALSTRQPAPA